MNDRIAPAPPVDVADWEGRKPALRDTLWQLLGVRPPAWTPTATVLARRRQDGYTIETLAFDNGANAQVFGYVLLPDGPASPRPAVLFQHAHGGEYALGKEEVFQPAPSGVPFGHALVNAGYVVLAIDAYCFGDRQHQGPAGPREAGAATELALFKQLLWEGKTLWGMMVRDDMLALSYLVSRPEVDPRRVATLGMSMGATRSWWLAALDERITVTIAVACLTHYQSLIKRHGLWFHSLYYFVPGVLAAGLDMEAVVGLIAPRPLLTLTGDQDAGSPVDGVHIINSFVQGLYEQYGAGERFSGRVYHGIGHEYTPEMWEETLAWLHRHL